MAEPPVFPVDPVQFTDFNVAGETHIKLGNRQRCLRCMNRPCTFICPSQVYEWEETALKINYPRCVECGACILVCPENNIDWDYPAGGYGVIYHEGKNGMAEGV